MPTRLYNVKVAAAVMAHVAMNRAVMHALKAAKKAAVAVVHVLKVVKVAVVVVAAEAVAVIVRCKVSVNASTPRANP